MKVKVGQTTDEIEVGQVKQINKGCLKSSFSLLFYPSGLKISGCTLFEQNGRKWFSMPQREVKYQDGRKTDYFPYVSCLNKDYEKDLKEAVITCLENYTEGQNDNQYQSQSKTSVKSGVQAKSPFDIGAPPF